ncbi:MAG TPA: hypothetical protein VFI11_06850 [Anaerolineales bacterium]|nr:hypothetical protein [Anaerolineales bacterium]
MQTGVTFPCSGEQAARVAMDNLSRRGLRVERSFDLHTATDGTCDCPYHGTQRCTCQYVVLLVYGPAGRPAVVTAHSRDQSSHLEIVSEPNAPPDAHLVDQIFAVLVEAGGTMAGIPCSPLPEAEQGLESHS